MSFDIGESCLAISKHGLVDVPTIEDVVAARKDSFNFVHQSQFHVCAQDLKNQ